MAYKKYIKRGGKVYGPYIYHSRRVDGKVISEYRGQNKKNYLNFVFIALGVLFLIFTIYVLFSFQKGMTGHAVLDLDANYQEGDSLLGRLKISLESGEFLPADSKIVFENNGDLFEYDLRGVLSEEPIETEYGEGYGIPGKKEIFPFLDFILIIESEIHEENDSLSVIEEIQGRASFEEPFEYILREEETGAELKPLSVKINGERISDNSLNVNLEEKKVIVTTDYSEIGEGFGENYTGQDFKDLIIDLSEFNLIFSPGELKISIISNGEEIVSLSTVLEKGQVSESVEPESSEESESSDTSAPSDDEILSNVTESKEPIIIPSIFSELTSEEREILEKEFGNISIAVTKAVSKNGFIVVRYELGSYWIENSYSEGLDNILIEEYMSRDRVKWLKDIAKRVSEQEEQEQVIEGYLGNIFKF